MPQHPLILFPEPAPAKRGNLSGGGGGIRKPSPAEQRRRLDARFQEIAQSFQTIQSTVQGLEPEQVLVLETVGEHVEGLAKAAAQIPGMEWLAEMDLEDIEPEAGFEREKEKDKGKLLPCRLYAVMTNQQAMDRLVGLWNDWHHNPSKRAKKNFGPFKNLFINLRDLRRWNAEDRIRETGLLQYLEEQLEENAAEIRFEVELWCRQNSQARERAYRELASLVGAAGGACAVAFNTGPRFCMFHLFHVLLTTRALLACPLNYMDVGKRAAYRRNKSSAARRLTTEASRVVCAGFPHRVRPAVRSILRVPSERGEWR